MHVEATTAGALETGADTIAIGVFEGEDVAHDLPGEPLAALLSSGEASREAGRIAHTHAAGKRLLLLGLGARATWSGERARTTAALALIRARELGANQLCWEVPHHVGPESVAGLVEGTLLRAYRFDRYKRAASSRGPTGLVLSAHHDVSVDAERAATITRAQNRARDLGNRPANDLTPTALAEYARELDGRPGVSVSVRGEAELSAEEMGAFAAVARGSAQEAQLIELRYDGTASGEAPVLGLIGKAVTFDSGGLSLKSPASMHEMKFDMGGGAAVIEAIAALAELQAPVRVLGLIGATENLPSSTSVRPGDIVTALDGTTIEVNNTDAEGRLILADLLVYARRAGCARLIDIATLTGGVTIALGSVYAGMTSNDEALAATVDGAGARTGELVWRLPLHERYAEMVRGRYADLTNRPERREAMSILAAEFLHRFAADTPWAHIDIAAVADNVPRPYFDKGATGFGVRLLVEVADPADWTP
jgi:leucyl aminopeptidase